ncbi:MAG: hypothetical protein ACRENY_08840 [Candidatus Dormibacteria bacterium]
MEAQQHSAIAVAGRAGLRRERRWALALGLVSLLGSLDIAQFIDSNRGMFGAAPGRASGSVLGLALWLTLTGLAALGAAGQRSQRLSRATVGVSGVVAVGSLGLTGVHAAAHVGGLRPALGGALGLAALGLAIATTRS